MAETPSSMKLSPGQKAPDFLLTDVVSGEDFDFSASKAAKGYLIMFICNHCPFVKHVQPELVRLAEDFMPQGIEFIAISSNDVENYPDDSPEKMKAEAKKAGYAFPYLYDESQNIAKAYDAACTPDFFLFDSDKHLFYRGRLDESTPGNGKPLTGQDLRNALTALISGYSAPREQYPSIGCNIKWKPT